MRLSYLKMLQQAGPVKFGDASLVVLVGRLTHGSTRARLNAE